VRHGISKALTYFEPDLRGILKKGGFLTRDSRVSSARSTAVPRRASRSSSRSVKIFSEYYGSGTAKRAPSGALLLGIFRPVDAVFRKTCATAQTDFKHGQRRFSQTKACAAFSAAPASLHHNHRWSMLLDTSTLYLVATMVGRAGGHVAVFRHPGEFPRAEMWGTAYLLGAVSVALSTLAGNMLGAMLSLALNASGSRLRHGLECRTRVPRPQTQSAGLLLEPWSGGCRHDA